MSFEVLVIPEDPQQNGYILKPLVKAIMRDAGKQAAKVDVLKDPRLRGYDHAVRTIRSDVLEPYRFKKKLWLFFPDADKAGDEAMRDLEKHADEKGITLLCCAAQPEVEIYACAAFRKHMKIEWKQARQHDRMKEEIFEPLLKKHGDPRQPGKGRGLMVGRSLENLRLLFDLCPELKHLRNRIATHLQRN